MSTSVMWEMLAFILVNTQVAWFDWLTDRGFIFPVEIDFLGFVNYRALQFNQPCEEGDCLNRNEITAYLGKRWGL